MRNVYLLKKMQRDGYYLRQTIQKKTKKSFGVQMMTSKGQPFAPLTHRDFDMWLDCKYIEKSTSSRVPHAKDLKFTYYVINKNYQFDLSSFGLSLDDVQVHWQNYTPHSLHNLVTQDDWDLASQLIIRTPPLFTLDEILLLAKFLVPANVHPTEYSYFEQYASFTTDVPLFTSVLSEMYDLYLTTSTHPVDYHNFHEVLEAFVKLAEVRRFVRERR